MNGVSRAPTRAILLHVPSPTDRTVVGSTYKTASPVAYSGAAWWGLKPRLAAADRRPCSNSSILPRRRAHSSKPAAPRTATNERSTRLTADVGSWTQISFMLGCDFWPTIIHVARLSHHLPIALCCCAPGSQEISIDCCTAGTQQQTRSSRVRWANDGRRTDGRPTVAQTLLPHTMRCQ